MPSLQSWRTPLAAAVLATALAGCGSTPVAQPTEPSTGESLGEGERELRVTGRVRCDQDVSSEEAKGIIERVGGLQQPTWSVRFAESTAAGVVVLVTGDLDDAEPPLFDDYHVTAIVGSVEGQARADDFSAVREAVRELCA
ncbi:hypothetical protein [Nocardioides sp.]|uniref:hypothetical protein n=1 Tax=Nocardioides sp. TaxID=35761 RepID=UPI0019878D99|nr:hypothetical protein [Nocardioides sp.]MBC7278395.1 hypothetical protein [Nocardioides sp.]